MIVTEREREAETQAEGEAGSMQGARCGIRSGTPGSRLGLKTALNRCLPSPRGAALVAFLLLISAVMGETSCQCCLAEWSSRGFSGTTEHLKCD